MTSSGESFPGIFSEDVEKTLRRVESGLVLNELLQDPEIVESLEGAVEAGQAAVEAGRPRHGMDELFPGSKGEV